MNNGSLELLKEAMLLVCNGQEEEAALMVACPPRHAVAMAADGLNVRRQPKADAEKVGVLESGTMVSIWGNVIGANRVWTFVIDREVIGWTATEYLTLGY
ncbi:MAG: SH3 domain-containing protein [Candidatus Eisenbacteria sp.]|nr:SH3 domain-containing protein [Candidatus Eisenbacteria bacterium]